MKGKILPPTYFIALLLMLIASHFVFPAVNFVPVPYNYLGVIFVALGVVLNLWADGIFKKAKTTVKPDETPTKLVTNGPFAISRHPMYLGMAAILLGAAVFLGSVVALIFPALFIIVMERSFIPMEEESMSQTFGNEYADYARKVRKWL